MEFIYTYKDNLIVSLVLLFMIIALYRELFRPATVFLIAIVFLSIFGILTPQEILKGFANEQIAVILLLLVIGDIIKKTEILNYFFDRAFKKAKTANGFLSRMMLYVSSISAFFNNTPLVALLVPYVMNWGKKHGVAPSKLLIPLSYAAILGGGITLIGTSTNLILNGLVVESGYPSLELFDFAYVGIPMSLIGLLYFLFVGKKLLPAKQDVLEDFISKAREYLVETKINSGSPLVNKTIEAAGLRRLKGLYLVEIIRKQQYISPVSPQEVLKEGDTLTMVGATKTVAELVNTKMGLSLPEEIDVAFGSKMNVIEAVVPFNSSLIGDKVKDTNFRAKYDAAILAVHRNGEKLSGKIGDIVLEPGDLLLLLVGADFATRTEGINDYYIISRIKEIYNIDVKRAAFLLSGTLLAILLAALKNWSVLQPLNLSLFKNLTILLTIFLVTRTINTTEVRTSINVTIWIIAAFALALGSALEKTGTAQLAAGWVIDVCRPFGTLGIMAGIFIITSMLAGYMSYVAAISITFPIAMSIALSLGQNYIPFALLVAFGASANFFTPIGYQTNLMVYGPGGYSFKDFFKVGFPLVIIYMIVTIAILATVFELT